MLQSIGLLVLYVVVGVIVGVVAQCVIGSEAWRAGGGETVGDWGGGGTARVVGRTSAAVRAHRNLERPASCLQDYKGDLTWISLIHIITKLKE